jgi:ferritin
VLSLKMQAALNRQINEELYSSYLYLAMAAYFHGLNLEGFAHWMHIQSGEENGHAMKFFHYIYERGSDVKLMALKEPQHEWASPLAAFQDAYHHEQHISGLINDLVNLALEEKDHATANFLQWFLAEQVEEEASADRIVRQLTMIADSPAALFMLDREMAQRQLEVDESEEDEE